MNEQGIVAAVIAVAGLVTELLRRSVAKEKAKRELEIEQADAWRRGDLPRVLPPRRWRWRLPFSRS